MLGKEALACPPEPPGLTLDAMSRSAPPIPVSCYPEVTPLRGRNDRVPIVYPVEHPFGRGSPEVEVLLIVNVLAGTPARPVVPIELNPRLGRHGIPQIAGGRERVRDERHVGYARLGRLLEGFHLRRGTD